MTKPRAKYALTGMARCGTCDGAVGCASTRTAGDYVKSYACVRHHQRGPRACAVSVRQPMAEIEEALVTYLESHMLSTEVIDQYAHEIREAIEAQIPQRDADVAELEADLRAVSHRFVPCRLWLSVHAARRRSSRLPTSRAQEPTFP